MAGIQGLEPRPVQWTAPDLNREPPPCQGDALPVEASSPGPPRPDTPAKQGGRGGVRAGKIPATMVLTYGAHAMEFSTVKPSKRRAGTAGIEPAQAALETAVLPLNYVPIGKKW
jgi:hypothetical protein